MTIATEITKAGPFIGNGVATAFPFAYKVFDETDVLVVRQVIATGVNLTLVLDSDYSVTLNVDQDVNPGGTVNYPLIGVPMPAAQSLTLGSIIPRTQPTDLPNGGPYFASAVENMVDRAIRIDQQVFELSERALHFPITDTNSGELPTAIQRALMYMAFDASGNPIAAAPVTGSLISVPMQPVVSAVSIPVARGLLGFNEQVLWCGTATGTANALILTPSIAAEALNAGLTLAFKASAAGNSGATTVEVSGLLAKAVQSDGGACVGGEVSANKWYIAVYDGAAFQISQIAPSVLLSLFTTKGDLLVATAAGKIARKGVGAAGSVVLARPADASGLAYVAALSSSIYGLTYQNNAGDAVNDLDIAAGGAMDATGAYFIVTAALTKQSDVVWAVGSNAGMLDTGAVGNSDYFLWQIARSDTGVTDILASLSNTAPTMPANYDFKRLFGWFKRVGGTIVAFKTYETAGGGIVLNWSSPTLDVNLANSLTTARRTDAVKVPLGVSVVANLNIAFYDAGANASAYIYNPDGVDLAPSFGVTPLRSIFSITTVSWSAGAFCIRTNTSGQIAARADIATVDSYFVSTLSFEWSRR